MSEKKPEEHDLVSVDVFHWLEAMERRTSGQRYLQYSAEFDLFTKGMTICLQLLHHVGDSRAADDCERVLRDLSCDVLDSLRCAEVALLYGCDNQSMVLIRRAYETTALMAYFLNFPEEAVAWEKGKEIKQSLIREKLDTAKIHESKDNLQRIYKVYSIFSHINRATIYNRLLGDGNRFTVGAQGNVSAKAFESILRELLASIMWFVDVMLYSFRAVAAKIGKPYTDMALGYRDEIQKAVKRFPSLV